MIGRTNGRGSDSGLPVFTYTGTYILLDDGDGNWRIKFTSSGTLRFSKLGLGNGNIDVFAVGGGGGAGAGDYGNGGGGGYTKTVKGIVIQKNTPYLVTIGEGGTGSKGRPVSSYGTNGYPSSFDAIITAAGGYLGSSSNPGAGGNGGSGGGSNGSDSMKPGGSNGSDSPTGNRPEYRSKGQISTPGPNQETGNTCEFGEDGSTLYSGGGGARGGAGGAGGGGNAGASGVASQSGIPNTGGGGGGGYMGDPGGSGGSGIVIIRNHRS